MTASAAEQLRIDALERGMAALTERIERLEAAPQRIRDMPSFLRAASKRVSERAA